MDLVRREPRDLALRQPLARQVRADLLLRLTERERLRLREAIGEREILLLLIRTGRVQRREEAKRDVRGALVQQLEERVLRIRARLAPDHRPRGVADRRPLQRGAL